MATRKTTGLDLIEPAPPVLEAAINKIGPEARHLFLAHLYGGTSVKYLSNWLERAGAPVSATTLQDYRRAVLSRGD